MTIDSKEWEQEREYLELVLAAIDQLIAENQARLRELRNYLLESRERVWEDVPHAASNWDEVIQLAAVEQTLVPDTRSYIQIRETLRKLKAAKSSPYFARIDFCPKGAQTVQKIYIGYSGIAQYGDNPLVYDWRSPIASMFYDFGCGKACYLSPTGVVEGTILLKRQYKIVDGTIQYMFDSDIAIDDEILQSVLSRSSDAKMKDIVTSIQKEQNRIIRDDKSKLLIVQGVAGSGKTSVAVHRAAYLLYKYRHNLHAHNILLFSPNRIFSDYISAVLPLLGEENITQLTFFDYVQKMLGSRLRVYTLNEQMELLLTETVKDENVRALAMQYKTSPDFYALLKDYAEYLQREGICFPDVDFGGKQIISGEELNRLFRDQYAFLPVKRRLRKIWRRVTYLLKTHKRGRFEEIRKDLAKNSGSESDLMRESVARLRKETTVALADVKKLVFAFDVVDLYVQLFQDRSICNLMVHSFDSLKDFETVRRLTVDQLQAGAASYEDAVAILFLKATLEGIAGLSSIKYLFIDEAQDYSLFHYEIMHKMFSNCRITMLGDLNQSIYPNARLTDYNKVAEIFEVADPVYVELRKSYRSTKEIVQFTSGILPSGSKSIEPIERHGSKPRLVRVRGHRVTAIARTIAQWQDAGCTSVAVICRSARKSRQVYRELSSCQQKFQLSLVTADDKQLPMGTIVIPSYLAKGLEFDGVLIPDAEQYTEKERTLLYTVCTRALHHLELHFSFELPRLLTDVDPRLYEISEE